MKKLKIAFLMSILFLGISCEQSVDETPVDISNVNLEEYIKMSLDHTAKELRANKKTFHDADFMLKSTRSYLEASFEGDELAEALNAFDGVNIRSTTSSTSSLNPALTLEIQAAIDNSESIPVFLSAMHTIKSNFEQSSVSGANRQAGLIEIEMNMITIQYYYENQDLLNIQNNLNPVMTERAGIRDWWNRNKAALKCAASIWAGAAAGSLSTCLAVGGAAALFSGPPGFIAGCIGGALVGQVVGGVTGAVAGGCFEL